MSNFTLADYGLTKFPATRMPFMAESVEYFKKHQPYQGLKIAHNNHLTLSSICKLAPLLLSGASLTITVSDSLQACPDVIDVLREYGVNITKLDDLKDDFDILLDCGAGLANIVHPRIGAVEQTQSGKVIFEKHNQYPVISVDESYLKKLETLYGTGDGFKRAFNSLIKEDITNKTFVIFGYGKVGHGIVRELKKMQCNPVVIVEANEEALARARLDNLQTFSINKDLDLIKRHLKEAFCVVTATGIPGVVSKYFSKQDMPNSYKVNMGTEDEFGENFPTGDVLGNKKPLNFILEEPTLVEFLDPIFYAHNAAIDLLLTKKFAPGFHSLPLDFDLDILLRWSKFHKTDVSEIYQFV